MWGQHRERQVVAHRADRLFSVLCHRTEDELQVFLGIAEGLLAIQQGHLALLHYLGGGRQVIELDADALDPRAVGLGVGERILEFLVVDDATGLEIDQEHLAGLQPPFLDDFLFRYRQHAGLRSHDDHVVAGHHIAGGAQTVAVERCADLTAIGKRHGGRSIPRLHHRRMVFVEGAPVRVHQRMLLPGFGYQHHHGVRQRVAAHGQQFQRVVERRGVGLPVVNQRPDLVEILAQDRAEYRALAGAKPIDVTAQRVDLAVVRDHAERMRQIPGWEGVGRKTLVYQRQRRCHPGIGKILVVRADLACQQHSLVDQRAR